MASAKHFVGDGATENGTNEGNTIASHDEIFNIHLAPYIDCIARGVCTVMASYSSWNGDKMHTHRYLLTEVLKDKLGFKVKRFELNCTPEYKSAERYVLPNFHLHP